MEGLFFLIGSVHDLERRCHAFEKGIHNKGVHINDNNIIFILLGIKLLRRRFTFLQKGVHVYKSKTMFILLGVNAFELGVHGFGKEGSLL